jgi:hypothetical protein
MGFPPHGFAPPGYAFHGQYPPTIPTQVTASFMYPQHPVQGNRASGPGHARFIAVPSDDENERARRIKSRQEQEQHEV